MGGGDTTPEGMFDVPRRFVYRVETGDGTVLQLAYTAFPPSPAGDLQMDKIDLNFRQGQITEGIHVKARGRYESSTNTLVVVEDGDFIETLAEKP